MYSINKNDDQYDIYETESDKVIYRFDTYKDARKRYNGLKGGQGFQGWTPDFIQKDLRNENSISK